MGIHYLLQIRPGDKPLNKAVAATATPPKPKTVVDFKLATPGTEVWRTFNDPGKPSYGRHYLIRKNVSGTWTVIAGPRWARDIEVDPGSQKREMTPEERAAREERQRKLSENRAIQHQIQQERDAASHSVIESAGIRAKPDESRMQAYHQRAKEAAMETMSEGEAEKFANHVVADYKRRYHRYVSDLKSAAVSQANAVVYAAENNIPAEEAVGSIEPVKVEVPKFVLPRKMKPLTAPDEAGLKVQMVGRIKEAVASGQVREVPELAEPEDRLVGEAVKEVEREGREEGVTPTAEAEPEGERPTEANVKRQVGPLIRSEQQAIELLTKMKAHEERIKDIRQGKHQIAPEEVEGIATAKEFAFTGRPLSEAELAEIREKAIQDHLEEVMLSTRRSFYGRIDEVDEASGGGQVNNILKREMAVGATEAFAGISQEILGGSIFDRRVVQALGVQGAALVMAKHIADQKGEDLGSVIGALEKYVTKRNVETMQEALEKAEDLKRECDLYDQQAREQVKDGEGNVLPGSTVLKRAHAGALKAENTKLRYRHLGMAKGSVLAGSSLLYALKTGPSGRLVLNMGDDRYLAEKALKKIGVRGETGKGYTLTRTDQGLQLSMEVNSPALNRYVKLVMQDAEHNRELSEIRSGKQNQDGWRPAGFREVYQDPDGKAKKFKPFPQQQAAIRFALKQGGGFFNVEVGGGKSSVIAPGFIAGLRSQGKIKRGIIVVPDGLEGQVKSEIEKFTDIPAEVAMGRDQSKNNQVYRGDQTVTVVGHRTFSQDTDLVHLAGYGAIVVDEYDKLGDTIRRKLNRMPVQHRIAMTGTPIRKGLGDAYDAVNFVSRGSLGPKTRFLGKYNNLGQGTTGWEDSTVRDLMNQIEPFTFTDTKPDKHEHREHRVSVRMTDEQKRRSAEIEAEFDERKKELGPQVSRARVASLQMQLEREHNLNLHAGNPENNAKLARMTTDIEHHLKADPKTKFMIFADSPEARRMIRKTLPRGSFADLGEQAGAKVEPAMARFNTNDAVRFLIINKARAQGLNAQRADVAMHFEIPANERDRVQKAGRNNRPGRELYGDTDTYYYVHEDHFLDKKRQQEQERLRKVMSAMTGSLSRKEKDSLRAEIARNGDGSGVLQRAHEYQERTAA